MSSRTTDSMTSGSATQHRTLAAAQVVGEGFHPQAGKPHAEVYALRAAGQAAWGATAYVTLEPCNHFGRTPPCSRALVAAGVSRVPFPLRLRLAAGHECSHPVEPTMQLFMRQRDMWGWPHTTSWTVLMRLVPLMMHQPHLHQPWRLDRCKPFIH